MESFYIDSIFFIYKIKIIMIYIGIDPGKNGGIFVKDEKEIFSNEIYEEVGKKHIGTTIMRRAPRETF